MNNVNKTLYIPLYGKAYVSKKGLFLDDKKAEEIWKAEGFSLKGKSKSKWLAYFMAMRSKVFDNWVLSKVKEHPDSIILQSKKHTGLYLNVIMCLLNLSIQLPSPRCLFCHLIQIQIACI